MKILYYNPYLVSSDGSGIHSREFVRFARQADVNLVTYPADHTAVESGLLKSAFGFKREWAPELFATLALIRGVFRSILTYAHLLKIVRKIRPDVIFQRLHPFDWAAYWLHITSRLPLVVELNSPAGIETGKIWGQQSVWIYDFHEKACLRHADGIIVVSSPLAKIVQLTGIPAEKILINPNGVDLDLFSYSATERTSIRAQLGISEQSYVIGFSGSLKPWHGIDNLMKSYRVVEKQIPDSCLLIIGGADGKERESTGKIIFTGKVSYQEMPKYLSACDVCVAPYPKLEPFYFSPIKVIEYMAMRIPVVASDQGQISELLSQERGILYDPETNDHLVEALTWVFENPAVAKSSARMACEYVEQNLTWKNNVDRAIYFMQNTIAKFKDKE